MNKKYDHVEKCSSNLHRIYDDVITAKNPGQNGYSLAVRARFDKLVELICIAFPHVHNEVNHAGRKGER